MKNILATLFLFLFCSVSLAQVGDAIPWRDGQILGISSRSGLTPVVVQLGTLSKIDHLAVVSVEADAPWIYEFTNDTGIQKIKLADAFTRAADKNNQTHFVVGEFSHALSSYEWNSVKERLDSWVSRAEPNPPANCLETVLKAFQGTRALAPRMTTSVPLIESIGALPLLAVLKKTYPSFERVPVLASVFEKLIRVGGNIEGSLTWLSEGSFLSSWSREGDSSKFSKLSKMDLDAAAKITASKRTTPKLHPFCEALF